MSQEVDFFLKLTFRLIGARYVVEGDLGLVAAVAVRPHATEDEQPRLSACRTIRHPPEKPNQNY
jgi:hypothetical protein